MYLRKTALRVQKLFLGFDSLAKSPTEVTNIPDELNPIFIVGSPRSGTTILLQELIKHSKVVHISNLMAFFPNQMLKIFLVTKSYIKNYTAIKESKYGYVPGLNSPNEAGQIFKDWFEKPPSLDKTNLIRNTINFISTKSGCPLISKNLNNCVRLENIVKAFPNMKIIFIRRDPLITAQSILLSRRKLSDNAEWFGVKPPGYEKVLKKNIHWQTVWQVKQIEEIIEKFINSHNVKCYQLSYEDFCANPKKHIQKIMRLFEIREKEADYSDLENRNEIKLKQNEWKLLGKSFQEIYKYKHHSVTVSHATKK